MKAGLVVDASIAAAWVLRDEADSATDALLDRVRGEGGLAPALWHWEIANILIVAIRRSRVTSADAAGHLSDLALLPISIDSEAQSRAWRETFLLAQTHALTAYDAAYLELAKRAGLPLASKDDDLRKAALSIGLEVLP